MKRTYQQHIEKPIETKFKKKMKTKNLQDQQQQHYLQNRYQGFPVSKSSIIKVFCRFRPPSSQRCKNMKIFTDMNYIEVFKKHQLEMDGKFGQKIYTTSNRKYQFTKLFTEDAKQEEVFNDVCLPLLADVYNEFKSSAIFSYGITNAGKTHTIIGNYKEPGLLPRFIDYIFAAKDKIDSRNFSQSQNTDENQVINYQKFEKLESLKYFFECYEIYNEDIFDLMDIENLDKKVKLEIKEGKDGYFMLKGIQQFELETIQKTQKIVQEALDNRQFAHTVLNKTSSRSHTVFKIIFHFTFENSSKDQLNERVQEGQLNERVCCLQFIDLAGSEKSKRTKTVGKHLTEACNINKSLLYLGQCIETIKSNQTNKKKKIIPFRNCKLTKLLYGYFHEDKNMAMIVNINPSENNIDESKRVLEYAALAKEINPLRNKWNISSMDLKSKRKPKKKVDPRIGMSPRSVEIYNILLRRQNKEAVQRELDKMKQLCYFHDTVIDPMIDDMLEQEKKDREEAIKRDNAFFDGIDDLVNQLLNGEENFDDDLRESEQNQKQSKKLKKQLEEVEKANNQSQASFTSFRVYSKSQSKAGITYSKAKLAQAKFKKNRKNKNFLKINKKVKKTKILPSNQKDNKLKGNILVNEELNNSSILLAKSPKKLKKVRKSLSEGKKKKGKWWNQNVYNDPDHPEFNRKTPWVKRLRPRKERPNKGRYRMDRPRKYKKKINKRNKRNMKF